MLPRQLPLHLVRFGRLHPRSVVAFAFAAWLVAGLLASRGEVETDILAKNDRYADANRGSPVADREDEA